MKRNSHLITKLSMTLIACVAIIIGACSIFAMSASAASTTVGEFTVTGGTNGTDFSYADGTLTILTSAPMTVGNNERDVAIKVASGVRANITLAENLQIITSKCPLDLSEAGESILTISAGYPIHLTSTGSFPGIYTPKNAKLTINGSGNLNATGGKSWPGIGGNGSGTLLINGPTVTASGGESAAGIGGSWGFNGGNIIIESGNVNAYGGKYGAGIGGGESAGAGGTITIQGGTVNATGGEDAAGIGGGAGDSKDVITMNAITIENGTVNAFGGKNAAGIGVGYTPKKMQVGSL